MIYTEAINSSTVVLVEFYASWCPHCQKMMPVVEQVQELLQGTANVFQYDIDDNQAVADAQGVNSIPTFIIYRNGQEVWRQSGEMEGQALIDKVQSFL